MKKVFRLFLIVLMLVVGLTGCKDNKKMNQKQLWEYLGKYSRYLTELGGEATAFVFDKDDDLTFDNSRGLGVGKSFYFTKLLSFSNENDYLYRLEYENPYPDEINCSIYYVELNPEDDTRIRFGAPNGGEIIYYDLYADVGLSSDKLLEKLEAHDTWREDNSDDVGYYFVRVDDKEFTFGIMNSGFGSIGDISKVEYKGYMLYTIIVDHQGYEGDEMTDPYDPYSVEYLIYYNHYLDLFKIFIDDELVKFIPKVDLDDNNEGDNLPSLDLCAELSKYAIWIEVDESPGGRFLKAYNGDRFHLGTLSSGGTDSGTITNIQDNGNMYYTVTVYYEGYEGDDFTEPFEAYTREYKLHFDPSKEIVIIELYGKSVKYAPDKGLHPNQFIALLSKYKRWSEVDEYGDEGYFIRVFDNDKFQKGIIASDYGHSGNIEYIEYMGYNNYNILVDYPGLDIEPFEYESYSESYWIQYDPQKETLTFIIDNKVVKMKPKK